VSTCADVKPVLPQLGLLWLRGWTTCHEILTTSNLTDNPLSNCASCLHSPPSKPIQIQPEFNPHPKVGYVSLYQFPIQIGVYTCIRISYPDPEPV